MISLSPQEKDFILGGVAAGIRSDGRNSIQYREVSIEDSVFPHCHGSSRVVVGGTMEILCSIRVEVSEPLVTKPDRGRFDVNVEFSSSCQFNEDENSFAMEMAFILDRFYDELSPDHDFKL